MQPTDTSLAIIGNGLSALVLAATLRKHDFAGEITIFGKEGLPPYDRVPLSKELLTSPELRLLEKDLNQDLRTLATNHLPAQEVLEICLPPELTSSGVGEDGDATVLRVRTKAASYNFDYVFLATGAQPLTWPAPQMFPLHTHADASVIRQQLQEIGKVTPVVVVGAGWVGCELAYELARHQVPVVLLSSREQVLAKQLGPSGKLVQNWLQDAGVKVHPNFRADDEIIAKTWPGSIVITALGARANTELIPELAWGPGGSWVTNDAGQLLTAAGLPAGGGRLYGAGDCVAVGGQLSAHWNDAARRAETIAARFQTQASQTQATQYYPSGFFSEGFSTIGDHQIVTFGNYDVSQKIITRTADSGGLTQFGLVASPSGPQLASAILIDHPREVSLVRKFFKNTPNATVEPTLLSDSTAKLRFS